MGKDIFIKSWIIRANTSRFFKITQRGLDYLNNNPPDLNVKILMQFDEFKNFKKSRKSKEEKEEQDENENIYTPQEALEYGIIKNKRNISR